MSLPTAGSGDRSAGTSAGDAGEVSLLDLALILSARKWSIVGITVATIVVATVVALLLPPEYTATVKFLAPKQNTLIMEALAFQLGSSDVSPEKDFAELFLNKPGNKNPNTIYVAMLGTNTVEDAIVKRFDLMQRYHVRYESAARKVLEHHVVLDGDAISDLIRVDVKDTDPKEAADIANEYVSQLRRLSESIAVSEASQRRSFLEKQLEQGRANLAQADQAMLQEKEKTSLVQADSQTAALIALGAKLRGQIAATEVQIRAMQLYATEENPGLETARQKLQGLQAQLAKLAGSSGDESALVPGKNQAAQESLEYERRLRDVTFYEAVVDNLAEQSELARLDEARKGGLVEVVDPAARPEKRSFPKIGDIDLGAACLGLLGGITFALASAFFTGLKEAEPSGRKLACLRHQLSWRAREAR